MTKLLYLLIGVAVVSSLLYVFTSTGINTPQEIACTMEAKICPGGSAVGRSGPNCEFAPCPLVSEIDDDLQKHIDEKSELIKLETPEPYVTITSPLNITGEARGYWFFEASFPVMLVNWDGLIITEGIATAGSEWMTEDFVPFSATLEFKTDFPPNAPAFMKQGALILKKDNPSGLPEHDDALEIPIVLE